MSMHSPIDFLSFSISTGISEMYFLVSVRSSMFFGGLLILSLISSNLVERV